MRYILQLVYQPILVLSFSSGFSTQQLHHYSTATYQIHHYSSTSSQPIVLDFPLFRSLRTF